MGGCSPSSCDGGVRGDCVAGGALSAAPRPSGLRLSGSLAACDTLAGGTLGLYSSSASQYTIARPPSSHSLPGQLHPCQHSWAFLPCSHSRSCPHLLQARASPRPQPSEAGPTARPLGRRAALGGCCPPESLVWAALKPGLASRALQGCLGLLALQLVEQQLPGCSWASYASAGDSYLQQRCLESLGHIDSLQMAHSSHLSSASGHQGVEK